MGGIGGDGTTRGTFEPVALNRRRPPIERWTLLLALALLLVVAKPWSSSDSPEPTGPPAAGAGTGGAVTPSHGPPTAEPRDRAASLVSAFCLDTRSWLVASVERSIEHSIDQRVRVWRALEPATAASGPDDPTVPVISVVTDRLTQLGWCAPVVGDETPSPPIQVTTWLRTPTGARPIKLDSSRPLSEQSPYGDLYGPPGKRPGSRAAFWPAGTYVFRYREGDGRVRWFAIEIEIRPRPIPVPSPAH